MPQPDPNPSLAILERRISAERFAPYRAACANDPARAIRLYERNLALSAAFWEVLSDLEILVRNAMHDKLTAWSLSRYGDPAWYLDQGKILDDEATSVIGAARRHAVASGKAETPGRVRGLHLLRNRIAHHEPIHNRPLRELHEQALATAGWVCPVTQEWIAARSRVPRLLSGPATPGR